MPKKEKDKLRLEIKKHRDLHDRVLESSILIKNNLYSISDFLKHKTYFIYVSKDNEVCTHDLISELLKLNKEVSVPSISSKKMSAAKINSFDELELGSFGVLQPNINKLKKCMPEAIDVVILPGLLFDRSGRRIGYGKGHYDQFLEHSSKDCVKIGLCFDFQLKSQIPSEPHDILVDLIVTEKEIVQLIK